MLVMQEQSPLCSQPPVGCVSRFRMKASAVLIVVGPGAVSGSSHEVSRSDHAKFTLHRHLCLAEAHGSLLAAISAPPKSLLTSQRRAIIRIEFAYASNVRRFGLSGAHHPDAARALADFQLRASAHALGHAHHELAVADGDGLRPLRLTSQVADLGQPEDRISLAATSRGRKARLTTRIGLPENVSDESTPCCRGPTAR